MKFIVVLFLAVVFPLSAFATDLTDNISSDRPGKSSSPTTVSVGHLQLEFDSIAFNQDYSGKTKSFQSIDPTITYGIASNLELQLTLGSYLRQNNTSGFGDIFLAAKTNVYNTEEFSAAIIPSIKLPVATKNFGNNHVELNLVAPMQASLSNSFSLTIQPGLSFVRSEDNKSYRMGYSGAINLSHPINEKITVFIETTYSKVMDHVAKDQVTFDLGAAYLITNNLQIDFGTNIGLNKFSGFGAYTGLAIRY